jgi:hypothetical protein
VPATAELSWPEVRRRRLAAHRLTAPAERDLLAAAVGDVAGIHAQLLSTAELSLGLRVAGMTRSAVRDALWRDRTLVRTVGLRGTVHVLPAAELGAWLTALRTLVPPLSTQQIERLGLSRPRAERIVEAIAAAVGGEPLTLSELEANVAERVGRWAVERRGDAFGSGFSLVRSMIGPAALRGAICFGPNVGQRVTYVRPEAWLGPQPDVDRDAALAMLVRRYLAAYGPATERDMAEWTYSSPAAVARAFDTVRDDLVGVSVEGRQSWWTRESLEAAVGHASDDPSVLLLPHFDVYLVGSRPRDELVPPAIQAAVGGRGLKRYDLHATLPVLVVDGLVAGLWQRAVKTRRVTIRVEPLVDESARLREGIDEAAARIASILERKAEVEIGPVEARPHL